MIWYGLVWFGLVCYDIPGSVVWYGMVRYGAARQRVNDLFITALTTAVAKAWRYFVFAVWAEYGTAVQLGAALSRLNLSCGTNEPC